MKRHPEAPEGAAQGGERVQLVCMPFQALNLASLSVALLCSVLRKNGVPTDESYFHFDFCRLLSPETYTRVATGPPKDGFVGEMLFAESYHGEIADERMLERLASFFGPREERAALLEEYRLSCLARIARAAPTLVGFTTSNYQFFPALWLAREIKLQWPGMRIVFGGAACNVPMGSRIQESYPEVDIVVSGAGEEPLLRLARGGGPQSGKLIVNEVPTELDALPIPDYGPFLSEALAFNPDTSRLMLAFESSRGCWWGQKSHCTFCGLNQLEMAFNQKSSVRVVEEVRTLWERHGIHLFATDTILSRTHLKEVIPALAAYVVQPKLFYEVKANMKCQEVRALRAANVVRIQPGIESLSSTLLKHIRKGVTAIQNLALLKWCREVGIRVSWNLLCGIPGERPEDYEEQIALMERIPQLMPAQGVSPIRIDRYSPYFRHYEQFGWNAIEPLPEYRLFHPNLDDDAIRDIAYYFDPRGAWPVRGYLRRLQEALAHWQSCHVQGEGLFWDEANGLIRVQGGEGFVLGHGSTVAEVLRLSHEIVGMDALCLGAGCDEDLIDRLTEEGVLYREGDQVVNLAVRL